MIESTQPNPSRPDPPDRETQWEAVPAPGWRLDPGRRCRSSAQHPCTNPSVAALARTYHLRNGTVKDVWWAYCERHMFGRWVENGQILQWRRVEGGEQP